MSAVAVVRGDTFQMGEHDLPIEVVGVPYLRMVKHGVGDVVLQREYRSLSRDERFRRRSRKDLVKSWKLAGGLHPAHAGAWFSGGALIVRWQDRLVPGCRGSFPVLFPLTPIT